MVESTIHATQAVVTLDVALPGIIWGWMITLNMWAKSIGTGVVFLAAFLWFRHKRVLKVNVTKIYCNFHSLHELALLLCIESIRDSLVYLIRCDDFTSVVKRDCISPTVSFRTRVRI
jgi:hypothetical protein